MKGPLIYTPRELFGFDIGHGSVKVVQILQDHKNFRVKGYGIAQFDPKSIRDGELIDVETVAKSIKDLFGSQLIGKITTPSVAVSLPVTHTFNRVITLPKLDKKDLGEAVRLEAEQYIPISIEDLYLDYQVVEGTAESSEILLSAAPRRVVDSYVQLFRVLGLDLVVLEPSILSVTRLVRHTERTQMPTLVVDLGSQTTDLIVYDSTVRVTGTIRFGGNIITQRIAQALNVSEKQAHIIKTKYGLDKSKKQSTIVDALEEPIASLVSEIKKVIRYYEDRGTKKGDKPAHVEQVIILGGGANLPGLSSYITNELRIPTRLCSPWENITFQNLQPPHQVENTMYATATGLALVRHKEVAV